MKMFLVYMPTLIKTCYTKSLSKYFYQRNWGLLEDNCLHYRTYDLFSIFAIYKAGFPINDIDVLESLVKLNVDSQTTIRASCHYMPNNTATQISGHRGTNGTENSGIKVLNLHMSPVDHRLKP